MLRQTTLRSALSLSAVLLLAPGLSATADGRQEATPETAPRPGPETAATRAVPPSPSPRPGTAPPAPPAPRQSYLGVALEDVTPADVDRLGLPEQRGALVTDVAEGSPADSSGFRAGDVILEWRDESVYSAAELERLVRETPPGRQVTAGVHRDGSRTTLRVTLRERRGPGALFRGPDLELRGEMPPEARARIRERLERARRRWEQGPGGTEDLGQRLEELGADWNVAGDRPRLGVRLQSLTPQLSEYFGLGDRSGVLIASVRDGSPADSAGLRAGDVLLSVDGRDVSDVGDAVRAVRESDGEVELRVLRRGEERGLSVRLRASGEGGNGADDPGRR